MSPRAHVAQGEHVVLEDLALEAQVEQVVVGGLEVGVHREHVEGRRSGRGAAEDGLTGHDADEVAPGARVGVDAGGRGVVGSGGQVAEQAHGVHAQARVRERPGARAVDRVGGMDGGEVADVVAQGVPAPKGGLAVPADVPGEPGPRPEVVLVGVVELVDALAEIHEPAVREEVRAQVVLLAHGAAHVVAEAQGQGEARRELPVVGHVEAQGALPEVANRGAEGPRGVVGAAQEHGHDGVDGIAGARRELEGRAGPVAHAVGRGALEVAAELEGVLVLDPGQAARRRRGSRWARW